jgi:hypothetical protein
VGCGKFPSPLRDFREKIPCFYVGDTRIPAYHYDTPLYDDGLYTKFGEAKDGPSNLPNLLQRQGLVKLTICPIA